VTEIFASPVSRLFGVARFAQDYWVLRDLSAESQ